MGLYLGRSYVKDKLFIPAMKAYSDALSLAKEKYLYDVAGYICSYMADLYTYTGQRSEERRKFEEAAEFFKQAGNERSYAFALRDVAKTWAFDDSLSLALHYMLIADSVITRFQDLRGISSISNGLGNIYDLMGDVEKARAYYSRSLSSDTMDQVPSYLALSDLYYNESLLDSARYYLALATGPSLNPYTSIDCFYLGYLIEKEAGDTEKALSLLEQYQAKKDSLYDQQKQVDIIDAEKRHDVVTVVQDNKKLVAEKQFLFALAVIICLLLIVGYQLQFELKHRLSVDATLLYGQKRGEIASVGNKATPVKGYKSKFARNYMALNGVLNYNLIGRLKVGVGVEPTLHFKDNIMIGKTIKSAFDVPVVVKAAYAFKYFDLALTYKHGTCNVMKGVPYMKSGRTRDLQVSIFVPIFR